MDTRIEVAIAADQSALLELLAAQLAEHEITLERERLAETIGGVFSDSSRGFLMIARGDGVAIGVAYLSFTWTLEHGGRSAWLEELYVIPALRNGGIGRRLLLAALEEATKRGCRAVDLEVEADHARAAHLYAREGFRAHSRARWVRTLTPRAIE